MLTFSFNHIALSVQDVDVSATFYLKVFQINEIKIFMLKKGLKELIIIFKIFSFTIKRGSYKKKNS